MIIKKLPREVFRVELKNEAWHIYLRQRWTPDKLLFIMAKFEMREFMQQFK